jgi:hypothetical protein
MLQQVAGEAKEKRLHDIWPYTVSMNRIENTSYDRPAEGSGLPTVGRHRRRSKDHYKVGNELRQAWTVCASKATIVRRKDTFSSTRRQ